MTFHESNAWTTFRLLLSFSCLCLLTTATSFANTSRLVAGALPIEIGDTLRSAGLAAGEPDCFRLETPSAGLLMIDVAVAGDAAAEPLLGLLATSCVRPPVVIERSASHLLVRTGAARSLVASVGPQDPRQRVGDFKLRTAFRAVGGCKSTDPEQIDADPDPLIGCAGFDHSTDPEQIDADPDPIFAGVFDFSTDPEQIDADPDPLLTGASFDKSTDPEQIDADPDPLRTGPIAALCAAGERDDHADVFLCATPLASGRLAYGEIANARGDDHDLFVFELTAARTVQIETAGDVDTFGGLFDRRGQRLAAIADGGEDGNFRLVKNLPAGLYFVRVEGQAWSQGAYAVAIDTLERGW